MALRSFGLILLLVVLVACAALTTLQSKSGAAIPCDLTWSAPQPLRFSDAEIRIIDPQIVATRRGIAFLGDNAFAFAPTDTGFVLPVGWPGSGDRMIAGFMLRPDGGVTPIPPPPGARAFMGVKAASDGAIAHVFWGWFDDTTVTDSDRINSVSYARFDGVEWSNPELLLRDSNLVWEHQASSVLVSQGRAHLMAIGRGARFRPEVIHVVRDAVGGGSLTRPGFQALYANLATSAEGALWLATIGRGQSDRALVQVRRSTDGGGRWSEPVTLHRSGRGTASDPRLAVTPTGSLFAGWIEDDPSRPVFSANRVSFATSVDNGASWQSLPAISAPRVRDLWVLADGPAALQISLHTSNPEGAVVGIRWDGGQWSPWSTFGQPTWFAAMLAAATPDSLYMAWQEWRFLGPERVPAVIVSRRRSCLD